MLLMVLMELRLKLSESSSGIVLVSLGDVVASCALVSLLVVAVVVLVIAIASVAAQLGRLGRYLSSGMSTTDSSTDPRSLSGVSASAANGLGVLIDADAVGVTTFGLYFITLVLLVVLYILSSYAKE